MGRKKMEIKKIENSACRQSAYMKRKEAIVKKANELSVLCDTDVGLLIFGPEGGLTSYASRGRVEDIFLRYMDRPDEQKAGSSTRNEEMQDLYQRLKHVKYEGEMLEKITKLEELQENLNVINQRKISAQEKLRLYKPNVEEITSIHEIQAYEHFLLNALQNLEQMKAKFISDYTEAQIPGGIEEFMSQLPVAEMKNDNQTNKEIIGALGKSVRTMDGDFPGQSSTSQGPHLSLTFLQAQSHLNLPGERHSPNLHIN